MAHTINRGTSVGPAVTAANGASCGQCSTTSSSSSPCGLPSGVYVEAAGSVDDEEVGRSWQKLAVLSILLGDGHDAGDNYGAGG